MSLGKMEMLAGAGLKKTTKWIALVVACFALNACASSMEAMNEAPEPAATTAVGSVQDANQPEPDMPKPLPKDAKILAPGSRVNDYVNESLPSQFAHTLQELNKAPLDDQYPAIADTPQSERRLLTLEERRKLEEELRKLEGS